MDGGRTSSQTKTLDQGLAERCGTNRTFDAQREFSLLPAPVSLAFKSWRQRQTFATPEIAKKAEHVEADLRALEKGVGQSMLASIARNVREFEAMLRP